jgi:nucleoside-diphosphate-sugar epimerase
MTTDATHVVLGAGPVGSTIAGQLADAGETVTVVTRSGRDPGIPGVAAARADITDPAAVRAVTSRARVVYFAAQPAYTDWPKGFPPLVDGVLGGVRGSGARLAVVDNLYCYGPTGGAPIREDLPAAATTRKGRARALVAERFMAAHASGDVQVGIARASDFFGPARIESLVGDRFFEPILAGKMVQAIGDPDMLHSVSYVPDFARTLIEIGRRDEALGGVWHVPSAPAVSIRRLSQLVAEAAGVPAPKVSTMPRVLLRIAGLFIPTVRELIEMQYEFDEPYVLDASKTEAAFGLQPTPFEVSLPATVAWWREQRATSASRKAA